MAKEGPWCFVDLRQPGSGKSTLMRFIAESPKLRSDLSPPFLLPMSNPIIATHYFNYEDPDPLAHNLEGLLRSLLWQILAQNHNGFDVVLPEYLHMKKSRPNVAWKRSLLADMLKKSCLVIVPPRTVPKNIRFCLSSRPYPEFEFKILSWNNLYTRISIDLLNSKDISTYVSAKFAHVVKQRGNEYIRLVDQINDKANNTFLWVRLVSERLVHACGKGESLSKLESRLCELPAQLGGLYERILDEMDSDERDEVGVLLGLVAAAACPLSLAELAYVVANICELPDEPRSGPNTTDEMRRRIEGVCGGLLEIRSGLVRFLHGTVVDHLRQSHEDVTAAGRKNLVQACVNALQEIPTRNKHHGRHALARYVVLHWSHCPLERTPGLTSNSLYLVWYELFLACSWELPLQNDLLTCQYSARRLQMLILFSNLNEALRFGSSESIQPSESVQHSEPVLVEDTASGFEFIFEITNPNGEAYAVLKCTEPGQDLPSAVQSYQRPIIHHEFSGSPARSGDGAWNILRQPERVRSKFPARGLHEIMTLERIAISSAIRESVSPLQLAAYHGLVEGLHILLRDGANIHAEAGTRFGTPLMASICGIIDLPTPTFSQGEPVFDCFEHLLAAGADPNRATYGATYGAAVGGAHTPLDVAVRALAARIDAMQSVAMATNSVDVLEDVPCLNLIHVVNVLARAGAVPNLAVRAALARLPPTLAVYMSVAVRDAARGSLEAFDDFIVMRIMEARMGPRELDDRAVGGGAGGTAGGVRSVRSRRYSEGTETKTLCNRLDDE